MSRSTLVSLAVLAACLIVVAGACGTSPDATTGTALPEPAGVPAASTGDAGAEEAGQEAEVPDYMKCDPAKLQFPLPDDAGNCRSFDILTTFTTGMTAADVDAFYAEALEQTGWARSDEGLLPGLGAWTKGTTRFELAAGAGQAGTDVQIKYYEE